MARHTMCSNHFCPIKKYCARSEASGTVPSKNQRWAWLLFGDVNQKTGRCRTHLVVRKTQRGSGKLKEAY